MDKITVEKLFCAFQNPVLKDTQYCRW